MSDAICPSTAANLVFDKSLQPAVDYLTESGLTFYKLRTSRDGLIKKTVTRRALTTAEFSADLWAAVNRMFPTGTLSHAVVCPTLGRFATDKFELFSFLPELRQQCPIIIAIAADEMDKYLDPQGTLARRWLESEQRINPSDQGRFPVYVLQLPSSSDLSHRLRPGIGLTRYWLVKSVGPFVDALFVVDDDIRGSKLALAGGKPLNGDKDSHGKQFTWDRTGPTSALITAMTKVLGDKKGADVQLIAPASYSASTVSGNTVNIGGESVVPAERDAAFRHCIGVRTAKSGTVGGLAVDWTRFGEADLSLRGELCANACQTLAFRTISAPRGVACWAKQKEGGAGGLSTLNRVMFDVTSGFLNGIKFALFCGPTRGGPTGPLAPEPEISHRATTIAARNKSVRPVGLPLPVAEEDSELSSPETDDKESCDKKSESQSTVLTAEASDVSMPKRQTIRASKAGSMARAKVDRTKQKNKGSDHTANVTVSQNDVKEDPETTAEAEVETPVTVEASAKAEAPVKPDVPPLKVPLPSAAGARKASTAQARKPARSPLKQPRGSKAAAAVTPKPVPTTQG